MQWSRTRDAESGQRKCWAKAGCSVVVHASGHDVDLGSAGRPQALSVRFGCTAESAAPFASSTTTSITSESTPRPPLSCLRVTASEPQRMPIRTREPTQKTGRRNPIRPRMIAGVSKASCPTPGRTIWVGVPCRTNRPPLSRLGVLAISDSSSFALLPITPIPRSARRHQEPLVRVMLKLMRNGRLLNAPGASHIWGIKVQTTGRPGGALAGASWNGPNAKANSSPCSRRG